MAVPFPGPHGLPMLPALAKCTPDAVPPASGRERIRSLAASLVAAGFDVIPAAVVARTLGLQRQTVHLWQDASRPGVGLAHLLGGPRPWSRLILSRALVLVDGPTARWSASPQALVARVIAGCAQVMSVIGQRDLDSCSLEELEQMRRAVAEKRSELSELERQLLEAQERKRQQEGGK